MARRLATLLFTATFVAGLLTVQATSVSAVTQTFNVTTLGDPVPDTCTQAPCTLREAVIAANANPGHDFINIPNGVVTLSQSGSDDVAASGDLDITDFTTITGDGIGSTFINQTVANESVFDLIAPNGHLVLIDLEVSGGSVPGFTVGGGVRAPQNTELNALRVRFTNNVASGGAVGNGGVTTLEECIIENNGGPSNVLQGGGVLNSGTMIITRSVFRNNTSGNTGAAIENSGGSADLTINESSFTGNDPADGAAVIDNTSDGSLEIDESVIADNFGQGISSTGGATLLQITDSTLSGNHSTSDGGALFMSAAAPGQLISNSTISGNQSDGAGGGAFIAIQAGSNITLSHNTITGNTANADNDDPNNNDSGGGIRTLFGGPITLVANIIVGNTDIGGSPSPNASNECSEGLGQNTSLGDNVFGDPGSTDRCAATNPNDIQEAVNDGWLLPLADNGGPTMTHAITAGAPAFNLQSSGGNGCPGSDQRGVARPQGTGCDAGSYELAGLPDLEIAKAGGTAIGGDIYNSTGEDQTVTQSKAAKKTATFDVIVGNDGTVDDFLILGCAPVKGFTVSYFDGATDVTADVESHQEILSVPGGSSKTLTVKITVGRRGKKKIDCDITAISQTDDTTSDTVVATVKRKT